MLTSNKRCNCKNAYQDRKYGRGRRVHNQVYSKNKWRCTVCGTERD